MPHVCPHCGEYALDTVKTPKRPLDYMLCAHCQRTTATTILPLFIVTGTSGAGKTTVIPEIRKQLPECVIFDKDLLLALSGESQMLFYDSWLLIAHSIAQGGRHTVICGTIMPWDLATCPNRGLVGTIHFLNLHCDDETRERRLRARPAWRGVSDAFIAEHKRFAQWQLDHATTDYEPPMPTIDTSSLSVEEAGRQIAAWVKAHIDGPLVREPSSFY